MTKFLNSCKLLPAVILILAVACTDSGSDEKSSKKSPIIKKKVSKLVTPTINQEYKLGDEISFEVILKDETLSIDSITLEVNKQQRTFKNPTFNWSPEKARVGQPKIKLTAFFDGKKETHYPKIKVLPEASPTRYTYRIINTYPHDPQAYTQGLFWHDGLLWESTGKEGASTMRKVDIATGKPVQKVDLEPTLFGEGAALHDNKIYQLTWHSRRGFVYDLELQKQREFQFITSTGEGWGLTNLNDQFILSDGSQNLSIVEPNGFTEIDRLQVYDDQGKITGLNELENVNGKIYANVYGEEYIAVIDPATGAVESTIDFEGIWPRNNNNNSLDYVLNGIAYAAKENRLFVTGKYWPNLYEVELLQRGNQP